MDIKGDMWILRVEGRGGVQLLQSRGWMRT